MLNKTEFIRDDFVGVVAEYNATMKSYSDGTKKIIYHSFSKLKGTEKKQKNSSCTKDELDRYNFLYRQKIKERVIDYAYENNPWEYFITLTFDNDKVNSFDYEETTNALVKWLNNQKHQNKDLEYLIVPELHKTGRVHFHGVVKNVPKWKLELAINQKTGKKIYQNGSPIYNLTNYKLGFTTISKIKNQEAVSVYISKYISKELLDIKNKKRYWCSKSLKLPKEEYYLTSEEELSSFIRDYAISYEKEIEKDNFTTKIYTLHANRT